METELWLGSPSSYDKYIANNEAMAAALSSGLYSAPEQSPPPESFTLFGNVGIIDVAGELVNTDSWLNSYFGRTSYNTLRNALIEAALHSEVKAIVLNIDSPGGTPNGLADTGSMIQQVSASGVPVYSHTGGSMCSAAYWLASATKKIWAGETATVGSIGCISIHTEVTDMMKQDGIKKTVFRAGPEKALGTPFEKLSDEAKAHIDERVTTLNNIFIDNIAKFKAISFDQAKALAANGADFIGVQALNAGLIDGMMTLDGVINKLQAQITKKSANGKETNMAKKTAVLTSAQQALIAEGVATDVALNAGAEGVDEHHQLTEVPAAKKPEDENTDTAATAALAAAEIKPAPEGEIVAFLRTELSAKNQEVVQLSTKLAGLETELSAFKSTHDAMKGIVATSISRMQIGLGMPHMDMSDMNAEVLLAQHAKTSELFRSKFPVGGVAAIATDESPKSSTSQPLNAARMRQNQI
jgi:signal peptide peptidase SppA